MPILQKRIQFWAAGLFGAAFVQAFRATWRVEVVDPHGALRRIPPGRGGAIVAFWHRHILSIMGAFRGWPICVPVSTHRDGEYIAHAMEWCGFVSVRGSTTRGSIGMLKNLLEQTRQGWSVAITPEGPQGPKYGVQPGVALLARRSGLPLYPVGIAVNRGWLAASWDDFVIPKPWARIGFVFGAPLRVDEHGESAAFCDALRGALFEATHQARELAGGAV